MPRSLTADWRLLAFGFMLMFWSSPGQTYLISLYGAHIRDAFDLNHASFGGLYSLGTVVSAAVLIWTGRLVDRLDLKQLALSLAVLLGLGCWFMSLTTGGLSLAIAFFLLRHSGQGLISHTATTAMSRYFEGARGRATAVAAIGFVAAEAVLPVVTVTMIAAIGWRNAWQITALAVLICLIPGTFWLLRNHSLRHQRYLDELQQISDETQSDLPLRYQWTRAEVIRDRRFYLSLPAILSPSFFFTGFFFHQVHLISSKGWDLSWWTSWFILYAGASLLATLITGPLVDRWGAVRLMPLFPLPLALALIVLSLSDAPVIGLLYLTLNGITAGWSVTVMGPLWAELYGVLHLGSIKALGSALSVFGSALSPFLLGHLFDLGLAIEGLALGSAVYIAFACALAYWVFRCSNH